MTRPKPTTEPNPADLAEALTSVRRIVTADPRDWTADRHDAFIYAIFRGFDGVDGTPAETDVAAQHGWNEEFLARLHRLHSAVELYLLHSSS